MALRSPVVDNRMTADVERQVRERLAARLPGWTADAPDDGGAAALLRVFARYVELTIERINQVPDRNLLAFLQHVGGAPRPAVPARAAVTFLLSAGARTDVVVPAGTQVSTSGTPLVVFETERQLGVTPTKLTQLFVKDPVQDRFTDAGTLLSDSGAAIEPFTGTEPIGHVAYIGHADFFGVRPLDQLSLAFDLDEAASANVPRELGWMISSGPSFIAIAPASDTTAGLTRSGVVRFDGVPLTATSVVDGRQSRWLRAEARTPLSGSTVVRSVTMERAVSRPRLPLDAALTNTVPLDLTKDFLPLGQEPHVGDVFYFAQAEAFSLPMATVVLVFEMTRESVPPTGGVDLTRQASLAWEVWDGSSWVQMGVGSSTSAVVNDVNAFSDTSRALTRNGSVTFRMPKATSEQLLAGTRNFWVRARLVGGGYEKDQAPSMRSARVSYSLGGPLTSTRPEQVLGYNDFQFQSGTRSIRDAAETFELFRPTDGRRAALYYGFEEPPGGTLPAAPFSLFIGVDERAVRAATGEADPQEPVLVWEYAARTGSDTGSAIEWRRLLARDRTRGLTRSGTVEVLLPPTAAHTVQFGHRAIWIRLVRRQSDLAPPAIRSVRMNTVDVVQTTTFREEILGSSNGTASQAFHAARGGILDGPVLEVSESDGEASAANRWQAWTEVDDFHASNQTDRHYTLDHEDGLVVFGDGVYGRVPPAGDDNVRFAQYRTGGGRAGNVPAGAITQMKTTIPYVERVTNAAAATGGVDAETADEYRERAPAILRHQHRAVTAQDYEDLARLASGEVARAKCLPLTDFVEGRPQLRPGSVTLIVVPWSRDPKPMPSVALLDQVHAFVSERQLPSVKLVVRGPEYVAIDVDADVVVSSLDRVTDVDVAIQRAIAAYLDPLRGGPAGTGWAFGRAPHRSDFFSLIAALDGVDHVRSARVSMHETQPGLLGSSRFLICVGAVRMWFYSE